MGDEPDGVEAPLEYEVIEESHQYILGSSDDFYVLLDKRFPEEPFERYSPDEEGYDQAYNLFRELTRAELAERQPWRPWIRRATMGALGLWVATGIYYASISLLNDVFPAEASSRPLYAAQFLDVIAFRVWVGGFGVLVALPFTEGRPLRPRRAGSLVTPLVRVAIWVLVTGMIAWIIGGVGSQLIADDRFYGGDPSGIPLFTRLMWALDAAGFRLVVLATVVLTIQWAIGGAPARAPTEERVPPTGGSS